MRLPRILASPLLLILLGALALRLAGGWVVYHQAERMHGDGAKFLFPDSDNFWDYAVNLADRGEYVDSAKRHAWRTPIYSIILAGAKLVGIRSAVYLRVINNLIDLLNIFLIYLLAEKLFGRRAGLIAAGIAACYPFFIYFSNLVIADTLAVTSVLLVALALAKIPDGKSPLPLAAGLTGLALAFAVMVKTAFAFLGFFVAGFLLLQFFLGRRPSRLLPDTSADPAPCPRRRAAYSLPLILLAFVIGMSPWWIRNYCLFERFVPFSTMGGFTLYESNSENSDAGPNNGKVEFPQTWTFIQKLVKEGKMGKGFDNESYDWLKNAEFSRLYDNLNGEFKLLIEPCRTFIKNCISRLLRDGKIFQDRVFIEIEECDYEDDIEDFLVQMTVVTNDIAVDKFPLVLYGSVPFAHWICYGNRKIEYTNLSGDECFAELYSDLLLKRYVELYVIKNPARFLSFMPKKVMRTWNVWPNFSGASAWYYKAMSLATYLPVMLLAACGLWVYRRRWETVYFLILPALYLTALHSVFMGSIRYRLPAMGCLIILAAGALEYFLAKRERTRLSAEKFL